MSTSDRVLFEGKPCTIEHDAGGGDLVVRTHRGERRAVRSQDLVWVKGEAAAPVAPPDAPSAPEAPPAGDAPPPAGDAPDAP